MWNDLSRQSDSPVTPHLGVLLPRRIAPVGAALFLALSLPFAAAAPLGAQVPPQEENASSVEQATDPASADSTSPDTAPEDVPEALTSEQSATDEELRNRLQAIFDRVEALSDVTVEVEAGVVRLSGTVAETDAASRAVALASGQTDAVFVENRIEFTRSLGARLEPTWERLREIWYGLVARLPLFAVALLIVVLAALLGRVAGRWGGPAFVGTRNPFLQGFIARVVQALVVLVGVVLALDLLDAAALVGAVAGTAGLAGLAVGFAFKDIVENYLAGILLAMRQPFEPNDHVVVEKHEGKVVRLTPRETILMTLDGNHVRLPNAFVFRNPLLNYTRNPKRRFEFDMGVSPDDDLEVARDTGRETLRGMEGVLADPPPEARLVEIGESWVTVRFFGWVDQRETDYFRVTSEAIRVVKGALEEVGVSLPSPEYRVRIQREARRAEKPGAEQRRAPIPGAPGEGPAGNISVDHSVDRQIAEERATSDEEDLLTEEG